MCGPGSKFAANPKLVAAVDLVAWPRTESRTTDEQTLRLHDVDHITPTGVSRLLRDGATLRLRWACQSPTSHTYRVMSSL